MADASGSRRPRSIAVDLAVRRQPYEDALEHAGAGAATTLDKTTASCGHGRARCTRSAASTRSSGLVGTKTWAHTAGGAIAAARSCGTPASGALRAVVEAFALGQLRTAATSRRSPPTSSPPAGRRVAGDHRHRQAGARPGRRGGVRPPVASRCACSARRADHRAALSPPRCAGHGADVEVVDCRDGRRRPSTAPRRHHGDPCDRAVLAVEDLAPRPCTSTRSARSPPSARELDPAARRRRGRRRERRARCRGDEQSSRGRRWPPRSCRLSHGRRRRGGRPRHGLTVFKAMGLGLADVAVGGRGPATRVVRPVAAAARSRTRQSSRRHCSRVAPCRRHDDERTAPFIDVSRARCRGEPDYWEPVIFRRPRSTPRSTGCARIERPANGRRSSVFTHPRSPAGVAVARTRHPRLARRRCCPGEATAADPPHVDAGRLLHRRRAAGSTIGGRTSTTSSQYDGWNHPSWRPYTVRQHRRPSRSSGSRTRTPRCSRR